VVAANAFATDNVPNGPSAALREVRLPIRIASLIAAVLFAVFTLVCARVPDAWAQPKIPAAVTLYIPSGIGGGYDVYGRLASRHLGRFLPGSPTLIPKNMPGAGGVVLANYLSNVAPKDGSAIALLQGGTPLEPLFGISQAKFDVTKFHWLISLNRLVSIGVFWHTSPARTADDLFSREILLASSGGGDSSTEIMPRLLNRLAGTQFKVISGYKGTGDGMLAMERGEVHGIVGHELSALRAARPEWLRDDKARIVIQIGLSRSPDLPDVPNALDLVKDEEHRQAFALLLTRQVHGRPFVAPPGTPADVVAALKQAFMAMAKDPLFLQDAAKMKADIVVNDGDEVAALYARTYATPRPLVERAVEEFRRAGGR
jgi:tripartite-type tricarboxylate transporter receptor subunit TctC